MLKNPIFANVIKKITLLKLKTFLCHISKYSVIYFILCIMEKKLTFDVARVIQYHFFTVVSFKGDNTIEVILISFMKSNSLPVSLSGNAMLLIPYRTTNRKMYRFRFSHILITILFLCVCE